MPVAWLLCCAIMITMRTQCGHCGPSRELVRSLNRFRDPHTRARFCWICSLVHRPGRRVWLLRFMTRCRYILSNTEARRHPVCRISSCTWRRGTGAVGRAGPREVSFAMSWLTPHGPSPSGGTHRPSTRPIRRIVDAAEESRDMV
ncbi:hypothetical protein FKP32DRAFT_1017364 [Trametes sanguinea]|nr:hypothetical protein FKP32DRAFT_1017364 [Trametes sanguinea]